MAGASVELGYTITGGDNETAIEAWGDGGWSATVLSESATTGKIKVTAPEKATNGKVVVLATSGAGGVAMKSLHFEEGILTGILDTYEVNWEACTLSVTLKTNLDYIVEIPTEAQSWLSIAEGTRATLRTETITFSIAENPEEMPARSAVVQLVSLCGEELQSFEVVQDLQPSSNPIEFADEYAKKVCVEKFDTNGDGELSYLEASRVTTIPSKFFGDYNIAVKSFDELQYFTGITSIGSSAFYDCSKLESIILPEGVTSIEYATFAYCSNLVSINIPDGITKIGSEALRSCISLRSINIPNSVTKIGYEAFWGCGSNDVYITDIVKVQLFANTEIFSSGANLWLNGELVTEYTFPEGTIKVDKRLSGCTSIAKITIPNGVISIENSAFSDCSSLESITIPEGVTSIGESAFSGCSSLESITIPDGVISIGYQTFKDCSSLESITIPEGVTSIRQMTFYGCTSLASINIPDGVTDLYYGAFQYCTNLTSVTIPYSVTSINQSFYYCLDLTEVYCKPITPPKGNGLPRDASLIIYVPTESVDAYKTSEYWSYYADAIEPYDFE